MTSLQILPPIGGETEGGNGRDTPILQPTAASFSRFTPLWISPPGGKPDCSASEPRSSTQILPPSGGETEGGPP
jgi:hypothetical protein